MENIACCPGDINDWKKLNTFCLSDPKSVLEEGCKNVFFYFLLLQPKITDFAAPFSNSGSQSNNFY